MENKMAAITCTNCNAVLKTKDPIPPGKKVKCPKCNQPFVVPAEEPADEVAAAVESEDANPFATNGKSGVDEEGGGDAGKAAKGKGDGKPKSKVGLIIGVVVGVLLLCCCLPNCISGIAYMVKPELFNFSGDPKSTFPAVKDGKQK